MTIDTGTGTAARVRQAGMGPRSLPRVAAVASGVAFAAITAGDGTPAWQLCRALAVVGTTAVLWAAIGRQDRVASGMASFAAGLVVLPVGVGIAAPHLAKSGPAVLTVAGLVALATGAALLISGAAALLRPARSWLRVPASVAMLLSVLVMTLSLGQAVAATNVPRTRIGSVTPADRGLPYREVKFLAADGVTLSGWYVPSQNGAAAVLLHGAGSTRSSVLEPAVVLARHGYGVLLYDARGHGRSAGRAMDFGWYGDRDLAGAVACVEREGVEAGRVAAVGLSMGGEEAIGAAAGDDRIGAVVAEGATQRVAGDKAWQSDQFGWRGAIQEQVDRLTYAFVDLLTAARPPIVLHDAVRATAPRRVLLIAAGSAPDEGPAARFIQSGSPETVELWVAPETGHTDALVTHPEEWEARVTTFLSAALTLQP